MTRSAWGSAHGSTTGTLALPAVILFIILLGAGLGTIPATEELASTLLTISLWGFGGYLAWRTLVQTSAGHFATDVVATLAIIAAMLLRQPLAGLIVVLMQTGGEALEFRARGRASQALRALEEAAPRLANIVVGEKVETVPAGRVAPGDLLLVRPGEMVPCDGIVTAGASHVDTSHITGEAMPQYVEAGARVASGTTNVEGSLSVRATALASASQYARIVELVRSAQASRAPMQRLADRYAVWFTPVTLLVCAVTYAVTHDPIRVLAILVVATPCPLILAVPVAVIGGINAAARHQIIVRSGGALETLAGATAVVFDKTGTLTVGEPRVRHIANAEAWTEHELLMIAGAAEQGSGHPLARAVVSEAHDRGIALPTAHVTDVPGRGVLGTVRDRAVVLGAKGFVLEQHPDEHEAIAELERGTSGLRAWVAVDGRLAGVIEFADQLRPGASGIAAELRKLGITRLAIRSGDAELHTRAIADAVGIADARGELRPEEKVQTIKALMDEGEHVVMVGDGTNDAPALGTAGVGIALASHGGGITAEAADVVVLADDLTRVVTVIRIARRTVRIARQSVWVGLGLSGVAMGFAAAGMIAPITGALLQEAIDVIVIINAVRASGYSWGGRKAPARAGIPEESPAPFPTEVLHCPQ